MTTSLTLLLDDDPAPAPWRDALACLSAMPATLGLRNLAKPWAASVRMVGADEAAALNASFRHKDYVPDVLSFPTHDADAWDGEEAWHYLGDVALTIPIVENEAAARGWPVEEMARHLAVHGLLHLMGYDHEDEADRQAMEQAEAAWLAAVGDPNPYNRAL